MKKLDIKDLPNDMDTVAVFDDEEGSYQVTLETDGTYTIAAESFDVDSLTAQQAIDELTGWGCELVGYEGRK